MLKMAGDRLSDGVFPMLIIAETRTTSGPVHILTGDDDLLVGAGVSIESVDNDAVTTWTGQHSITVAGTIRAQDDAINTIGCLPAQTVAILAGAQIVTGADRVVTDADGVILDGAGSILSNAGSIISHGSAASLFVRDGATTTVRNTGHMEGDIAGVWNKFGTGTLEFFNSGTVQSPGLVVRGGLGQDNVVNTGRMIGALDLGDNADLYDGRLGSVTGEVAGGAGNDTLRGGNEVNILSGGSGDDFLFGGNSATDLRDELYGGDGRDWIDGGYGNDEIRGGSGDDTMSGDFGADTLIGNDGKDNLLGGALSDMLFGGAGSDTLNGGFGHDRLNGGAGADRFFHIGVAGHGSDWIQDYSGDARDILVCGLAGAMRSQFQVNIANTPGAGAAGVQEAFVIYRPTGQILWALVDGA
ncbi:MAG: hypothetical protein IAE87_00180, partial [Rhodobacteraceae bacterium]|nr:hypothetical protein [Paracoccaceae bacterium]